MLYSISPNEKRKRKIPFIRIYFAIFLAPLSPFHFPSHAMAGFRAARDIKTHDIVLSRFEIRDFQLVVKTIY